MKVKTALLLFLLLASVFTVGCKKSSNSSLEPKELIDSRCSRCHTLDQVYSTQLAAQWPTIVDRMISLSPGLLSETEK